MSRTFLLVLLVGWMGVAFCCKFDPGVDYTCISCNSFVPCTLSSGSTCMTNYLQFCTLPQGATQWMCCQSRSCKMSGISQCSFTIPLPSPSISATSSQTPSVSATPSRTPSVSQTSFPSLSVSHTPSQSHIPTFTTPQTFSLVLIIGILVVLIVAIIVSLLVLVFVYRARSTEPPVYVSPVFYS